MGKSARPATKPVRGPRITKPELSAVDGRLLKAPERRMFARNIKAARKARGMSVSEMARRLDADRGYVSRIEAGEINVSIDRMASFALLFDVALHELLHPRFKVCDKTINVRIRTHAHEQQQPPVKRRRQQQEK